MILVTGGCGYIGSHIVNHLSKAGEEVLVFDNLSAGSKDNLLRNEELIVGDITSKKDLQSIFTKYSIDLVIHCAALVNAAQSINEPERYQEVNDQGSLNVWEIASSAGVKHFVYASSAAIYGIPEGADPITEISPLKPTNPYGVTKLAGEKSLHTIATSNDANYAALRFFNVGGAEPGGQIGQRRDSTAITPSLFSVAVGNDPLLTIHGNDYDTPDGTVIRDFIHVEDIASAIDLAVKYLRNGGASFIANLGSGTPSSIKQLIELVKEVTKAPIEIVYGPRKSGDISYSLADITKAKAILNWHPKHDLRDIVQDGWNFYAKK